MEIFGKSAKHVTKLSLLRVEGALIFIHQPLGIILIKVSGTGSTPVRYRALSHRDIDTGSWKSAGGHFKFQGFMNRALKMSVIVIIYFSGKRCSWVI